MCAWGQPQISHSAASANSPISSKLSEWETRHSTVEKECLVFQWAINNAPSLLPPGLPFHPVFGWVMELQCLRRMKDANVRITWWHLALHQVVHRPGMEMVVTDFLSCSARPRWLSIDGGMGGLWLSCRGWGVGGWISGFRVWCSGRALTHITCII